MQVTDRPIKISISTLTILKVVFLFVALFFLYLIRDILVVMFVSLILASALDPGVSYLQRRKIPRGMGIILIYLVLFITIGLLLYLIIPPIISQINDLSPLFLGRR